MQRTASTDSLLSRATEESGDAGKETHHFTLRDEDVAACSSAAAAPPHAVACGSQDHEVKGHIGVYQGNWGGHRKNTYLRDHVASDVCCGNVCQVITAQEVDKSFATLLQNANLPGGSASAVADADKRKDFYGSGRVWTHQSWIVASGDEKEKTCIVAGRASIFSGITIVEWHKTLDGRYKNRGKEKSAFSRVLVADLHFARPTLGRSRLRVASIHVHCSTAKRMKGMASGANTFYEGLFALLIRTQPDFIGGDFNMGLFNFPKELDDAAVRIRTKHRIVPVCLASYVWRVGEPSMIAEVDGDDDDEDDAAAVAALPAASSSPAAVPTNALRFDSCGIFALGGASIVRRSFTPAVADGGEASGKVPAFRRGQGYEAKSYVGGVAAFRRLMDVAPVLPAVVGMPKEWASSGCVREDTRISLPKCSQKLCKPDKWDFRSLLFEGGGHMPLMIFIESPHSHRTPEAAARRRAKSSSRHRSAHWQGAWINSGPAVADQAQTQTQPPPQPQQPPPPPQVMRQERPPLLQPPPPPHPQPEWKWQQWPPCQWQWEQSQWKWKQSLPLSAVADQVTQSPPQPQQHAATRGTAVGRPLMPQRPPPRPPWPGVEFWC